MLIPVHEVADDCTYQSSQNVHNHPRNPGNIDMTMNNKPSFLAFGIDFGTTYDTYALS